MRGRTRAAASRVSLPRRVVTLVRRNGPLAVLDIAIVLCAYLVSISIRFHGKVPGAYWNGFWRWVAVFVVVHLALNHLLGLYGQMWRYASVHEARHLLMAGAAASAVVVGLGRFAIPSSQHLSSSVLGVGALLSMLGFGAVRFQSRLFAFRRRSVDVGQDVTPARMRVLVMGAGDAGAKVLRDIVTDHSLGIDAVGIIDDDARWLGRAIHGVTVLGDRTSIEPLAARLEVHQLLLAIPSITSDVVQDVAARCERADLSLRVLPSLSELVGGHVSARDLRSPKIEDMLGRQQAQLDLGAVARLLSGRRVLITGAGGSIGSEIARQVSAFSPASLVLLDHDETHLHDMMMDLPPTAVSVLADVRDRARVVEVFLECRPEVVFHAAAHKHVPILESYPQEAFATNVLGTSNVVDATLLTGAEHFVLISTDKAVRPVSVMGGSKRIAEDLVRSQQGRGTVLSVVRFGNVLASRGSVVPTFRIQIDAGGPVTVTDPEMTRYFMSIREAVELVLQAAAIAAGGEVFTLDMGRPVNILDLARRMIRLSGRVPYRDVPIVVVGARPGEKLHEQLVDPDEDQVPSEHPSISIALPEVPDRAALRRALFEMQQMAGDGRLDDLAERLRRPDLRLVDLNTPATSPATSDPRHPQSTASPLATLPFGS